LALLRAAHTNVSPLWLIYEDPEREVAGLLASFWSAVPLIEATVEGEQHILRVIRDPATLRAVTRAFASRRLYVADGHHRYHTAQLYRDERRRHEVEAGRAPDPDAGYEFALMLLVALDDPGMLLRPTHRLVRGLAQPLPEVRAQLGRWFDLTPLAIPASDAAAGASIEGTLAEAGRAGHAFMLLEADGAWLLRPRADVDWSARLPADHTAMWRALDVVVLDTLAIRDVCGIRAEAEAAQADATGHGAADRLTYTSDFAEAVHAVRSGETQQAYLLNPTSIEQVCAVAAAGDEMPPKSTFFVPKPLTGVTMHSLEGRRSS
ncbi:MAG TPA: DUF1015 family protein, partial [Dehalococcoidia bacterium]